MDTDDVLDTLLGLEHQGWEALCDSTGDRFYGDLMTDDGLMVLADGSIMDRDTVVESLGQAPPWRTYDISDERLVPVTSDVVALVYRGTAGRDPDEPAFTALMSSTYVRHDGRWRLALYQQTPSP